MKQILLGLFLIFSSLFCADLATLQDDLNNLEATVRKLSVSLDALKQKVPAEEPVKPPVPVQVKPQLPEQKVSLEQLYALQTMSNDLLYKADMALYAHLLLSAKHADVDTDS